MGTTCSKSPTAPDDAAGGGDGGSRRKKSRAPASSRRSRRHSSGTRAQSSEDAAQQPEVPVVRWVPPTRNPDGTPKILFDEDAEANEQRLAAERRRQRQRDRDRRAEAERDGKEPGDAEQEGRGARKEKHRKRSATPREVDHSYTPSPDDRRGEWRGHQNGVAHADERGGSPDEITKAGGARVAHARVAAPPREQRSARAVHPDVYADNQQDVFVSPRGGDSKADTVFATPMASPMQSLSSEGSFPHMGNRPLFATAPAPRIQHESAELPALGKQQTASPHRPANAAAAVGGSGLSSDLGSRASQSDGPRSRVDSLADSGRFQPQPTNDSVLSAGGQNGGGFGSQWLPAAQSTAHGSSDAALASGNGGSTNRSRTNTAASPLSAGAQRSGVPKPQRPPSPPLPPSLGGAEQASAALSFDADPGRPSPPAWLQAQGATPSDSTAQQPSIEHAPPHYADLDFSSSVAQAGAWSPRGDRDAALEKTFQSPYVEVNTAALHVTDGGYQGSPPGSHDGEQGGQSQRPASRGGRFADRGVLGQHSNVMQHGGAAAESARSAGGGVGVPATRSRSHSSHWEGSGQASPAAGPQIAESSTHSVGAAPSASAGFDSEAVSNVPMRGPPADYAMSGDMSGAVGSSFLYQDGATRGRKGGGVSYGSLGASAQHSAGEWDLAEYAGGPRYAGRCVATHLVCHCMRWVPEGCAWLQVARETPATSATVHVV